MSVYCFINEFPGVFYSFSPDLIELIKTFSRNIANKILGSVRIHAAEV